MNQLEIFDWIPGISLQVRDKFEMNGNHYEVTDSSDDIALEMTEQGKKDQEFIRSIYDSGSKPSTT